MWFNTYVVGVIFSFLAPPGGLWLAGGYHDEMIDVGLFFSFPAPPGGLWLAGGYQDVVRPYLQDVHTDLYFTDEGEQSTNVFDLLVL